MRISFSILLLAILAALAPLEAAERLMVLTFDDLPAQRAQSLSAERTEAITDNLVSILASKDIDSQKRLGEEYVAYMLRMVRYYEDQSHGLFAREIPQILLVHANELNASYMQPLLAALRDRRYRFIDLETALKDPAYQSPDTYVGPGGITWLHRWAITRGVDKDFYRGEPTTPQWVQVAAGNEE